MGCSKTIVYDEACTLHRSRRRSGRWGKPHPDQAVLAYWDPAHKEELEKFRVLLETARLKKGI